MNSKPKPSVVIFAKNVLQLAQFYRELVGMSEVHQDKDHVVLDDAGFQVVIHGIPQKIAASIQISQPPSIRDNTTLKFCLPVSSIGFARAKASELGGAVGPIGKEWAARGFRACDGHDPEGNVFQVRESAA